MRCAKGWWPVVAACLGWASVAAAEVGCPVSRPQSLALPATRAALAAGKPITIVAFGSSSTEGSGASSPDRTYPARLQALLRVAWRTNAVTVLNRGQGGQTVQDMLARLDDDVLRAAPTLVIWQDGANAALREIDPGVFATMSHEGVERIKSRGIDLVLMDNQVAPRILAKPRNGEYGAILAREAAASGVSLFSRTALMRDWAASEPHGAPMIGSDGLHHTDRGYDCLAGARARAIETGTGSSMPVSVARTGGR